MHGVIRYGRASLFWAGPSEGPLAIARRRKEQKLARNAERKRIEQLAAIVADVLNRAPTRYTPFHFEGDCRHAVRVVFIFAGKSWPIADFLAAEIVQRGLAQLGAVRPTWDQAQPEYALRSYAALGRASCAHCGEPVERETSLAVAYCSRECQLRAKNQRGYAEHNGARVAYAQERRDALRAQAELRQCEWCGAEFRPLDYAGKNPQRFCSLICRSRFASSCATGWRPARIIRDRSGRFAQPSS